MDKRTLLVVAVAAIVLAWSISPLARLKIAGNQQPTETSAPISSQDMTIKQGNVLPVEYWAHPF
jgi:hypothetical protein